MHVLRRSACVVIFISLFFLSSANYYVIRLITYGFGGVFGQLTIISLWRLLIIGHHFESAIAVALRKCHIYR